MIRFLEGFEAHRNGTYFARTYATVSGAPTAFPAGRKVGAAAAQATNFTLITNPLVDPIENTWILGFGYFGSGTIATGIGIRDAASVNQLVLQFAAGTTPNSFTIAVKRGSTTLATSAELQANRWHFFEFKATIRTATNGSYELKDDGVTILSAASVNTADTGADGASVFAFDWGGGVGTRFDDIYICDDTGGVHDDFLGDKAIIGALPNAEGATNDWLPSTGTDNSALVDDPSLTEDDTDYVSSNTDGDVDLYEFGNLTELADDGTLDAIMVTPILAMFSSGFRGVKVRFRTSGGSTADSAQIDIESKTLKGYPVVFDEDPVALAAWTKTALDGGQLGILNFVEL